MARPSMHAKDPQGTILRFALVPFTVVSTGLLIGYGVAKGWHSELGVIVAIALVSIFFGSGLYIERRVRELHPMAVMGAAMASFAIKFMLLAGFLLALRNTTLFDPDSFAVAAISLAIVWLIGEVQGFTRARFLYTDAGAKSMGDY